MNGGVTSILYFFACFHSASVKDTFGFGLVEPAEDVRLGSAPRI